MEPWDAAVGSGLLRVGVGAALLRWRRPLATFLSGRDGLTGLCGYFGARDVALGVLTLAATRPGGNIPRAIRWHAVADATDGMLILGAHRHGRLDRNRAIAGASVAGLSALAFLGLSFAARATSARSSDRDPAPESVQPHGIRVARRA